jgi:Zn-dependent protease
LAGEKPDFKTDESIYRVTFGDTMRTEPGWAFGRFYSVTAAAFGSIALVSAAGAWFGLGLIAGAWKSAAEGLLGRARKLRAYGKLQRRGEALANGLSERWRRRLPWVITGIVLAGVTAWSAWSNQPSIGWATIPLALAVTAWAVALHELAHVLVARRLGGRLVPAQWGTGVGLAILLAPIKATSGPFTGVRVEGTNEKRAWWIHLAGPAVSIVLAIVLWGLYLLRPLPVLLLGAEINLAVAAYNLLPNESLDGHPLVANRPWVVAVLSSVVVGLGTVFALGLV